jgi:hypothetical protein
MARQCPPYLLIRFKIRLKNTNLFLLLLRRLGEICPHCPHWCRSHGIGSLLFASGDLSPVSPANCPNRRLGCPRRGCLMATAGDDAVAIPDYVAIGVLIVMILFAVARLFVRGSSETRELHRNFSFRPRTKFIEPCLPSRAEHPPDGAELDSRNQPRWLSHNGSARSD